MTRAKFHLVRVALNIVLLVVVGLYAISTDISVSLTPTNVLGFTLGIIAYHLYDGVISVGVANFVAFGRYKPFRMETLS